MSQADLPQTATAERLGRLRELFPGLALSVVVAFSAAFLSEHYGGPAMLFALLVGMALHTLVGDGVCVPGVTFAAKKLLRIGVALLGARITADQVLAIGIEPLLAVGASVLVVIIFGWVLARFLGLNRWLGILSGGSVAICGASAAAAISAVLPNRPQGERDTVFAVIGVTTLSTLAMVLYPLISRWVGFNDAQAGFFIGATIHDVAQVVGAGYSISDPAGDVATVVKLFRVALLVPVVIGLSLSVRAFAGGTAKTKAPFPMFLVGFIALVVLNSLGGLPAPVAGALSDASRWFLVIAIAAIGLKTSLADIRDLGPRAVVLIVAETVLIAVIGIIIGLTML